MTVAEFVEFIAKDGRRWEPIELHQFPWEPSHLTVAAYDLDSPETIEIFECTCSKGLYYPDGEILALDEAGWRPFAWRGVE